LFFPRFSESTPSHGFTECYDQSLQEEPFGQGAALEAQVGLPQGSHGPLQGPLGEPFCLGGEFPEIIWVGDPYLLFDLLRPAAVRLDLFRYEEVAELPGDHPQDLQGGLPAFPYPLQGTEGPLEITFPDGLGELEDGGGPHLGHHPFHILQLYALPLTDIEGGLGELMVEPLEVPADGLLYIPHGIGGNLLTQLAGDGTDPTWHLFEGGVLETKGTVFGLFEELRRHPFRDKDQGGGGGGRLQIGDEGAQVALAVVMGPLDQDYPALGHAGEGVAGGDDLRRPDLVRIV